MVAARTSEYPSENDTYSILSLKPIDPDKFLASRYVEDEYGNKEKLQALLEKNGLDKEIQNSPLLLTMVVLLAKREEKDVLSLKKELPKYERYNIKPLSKIQNKKELYESVVGFMLIKHLGKGTEDDLERWMKELGEYAYQLSQHIEDDTGRRLRDHGIYEYPTPLSNPFPKLTSTKERAYRENHPLLYKI